MKNKKMIKSIVWFFVVAMIASGSYYIGTQNGVEVEEPKVETTNELTTVYNILKENWFDYDSKGNIDQLLLSGLVAGLDDPYTELLTGNDASDLMDSIDDIYYGIGIAVNKDYTIDTIQANSIASKSELLTGDLIVRVDNRSFEDIDQLSEYLREENSKVKLTVKRNGNYYTYDLKKEEQDGTIIYSINDNVGYIMLRSFGTQTASILREALNYFEKEKIKEIQIDLRDNLGGYVDSALNILEYFLKTDTVLCTLEDSKGNVEEYRAKSDEQYVFEKGSILVNRNTASASEILAGCLQEKLGYTLIGETTYGKGIAQTYYTLDDLSVLKYTFAAWKLPSGKTIQNIGLEVDEEKDLASLRYEILA